MGDGMAGKTFRRAVNADPIFFEVEKEDGELLRFDCNPRIPGGVLLAFSGGVGGEDRVTQEQVAVHAYRDLINHAVVKAQLDQFWAMVSGTSEDGMIDIPTMMQIAEYLGEAYAERPTGQSSANGSPTTSSGSASTAGALHGVPTYSRSMPSGPSTSLSSGQRSVPL